MKPIGKKLMTGTIAAAFLIGGAGALHITQANAATGTSTADSTTKAANDQGKRGHENNLLKQAATILGVDEATIKDQLKQGKTLAQIAQDKGVTEDVLLQKLTDAENQKIDAAVTAGNITQAEADKRKSGLADKLKKVVENAGFGKEKGEHRGFGREGKLAKQTATILGVDEATIKDQLKQGKTLAQIAQDKGVTEDVLLQKLTDAENQAIDSAVTAGKITQTQADKMKSGLADRLKKEVENTVKHEGHEKGRHEAFADPAALAKALGITKQELMTALQSGQSVAELAQSKGISEDQLITTIKDSMTDKIKKFVEKKHQPKASETSNAADSAATPAAPAATASPAAQS